MESHSSGGIAEVERKQGRRVRAHDPIAQAQHSVTSSSQSGAKKDSSAISVASTSSMQTRARGSKQDASAAACPCRRRPDRPYNIARQRPAEPLPSAPDGALTSAEGRHRVARTRPAAPSPIVREGGHDDGTRRRDAPHVREALGGCRSRNCRWHPVGHVTRSRTCAKVRQAAGPDRAPGDLVPGEPLVRPLLRLRASGAGGRFRPSRRATRNRTQRESATRPSSSLPCALSTLRTAGTTCTHSTTAVRWTASTRTPP